MKKVQRLSREELNALYAESAEQHIPAGPSNGQPKAAKKSYVSKLKNAEVADYFKKFGYIDHERFSDEQGTDFIFVTCETFDALLNDFDVAIMLRPEASNTISDFNLDEFGKICRHLGLSRSEVLADLITSELMTPRFPSYAEERYKHQIGVIDSTFESTSPEMRKILSTMQSKLHADAKTMKNKGVYGEFDAETFLSAKYGGSN